MNAIILVRPEARKSTVLTHQGIDVREATAAEFQRTWTETADAGHPAVPVALWLDGNDKAGKGTAAEFRARFNALGLVVVALEDEADAEPAQVETWLQNWTANVVLAAAGADARALVAQLAAAGRAAGTYRAAARAYAAAQAARHAGAAGRAEGTLAETAPPAAPRPPRLLACPFCTARLPLDLLRAHVALWHAAASALAHMCPFCQEYSHSVAQHLLEQHEGDAALCATVGAIRTLSRERVRRRTVRQNVAVRVSVRRGSSALLVLETRGRGWMLPGGHVRVDETPADTARRALSEEANLTGARLLGIRCIEYARHPSLPSITVVFDAEADQAAPVRVLQKALPDRHSIAAVWVPDDAWAAAVLPDGPPLDGPSWHPGGRLVERYARPPAHAPFPLDFFTLASDDEAPSDDGV